MNRRSIAFKLMSLYSGTLLLAGLIFSLFAVFSFRYYAFETLQSVVSTRAYDIWNVAHGSLNDPKGLNELIEKRFSPSAEDRFIRVSVGGRIIYRSGTPFNRNFFPQNAPPLEGSELPKTYQIGGLLIYANRFSGSGEKSVIVESGQPDAFSRDLQADLIVTLAIGLPILLGIAAIGGYILIRRALSPVELMIRVAEEITFNNPRNRLPLLGTGDRIEALGIALNRMLDRLDSAYQHASRFSTDAAHELRTPLSIIQAGLEFSITNHHLPDFVKDYLADLLDEATRLGHMADNLLALSRMDSIWGKRVHAEVDLYALAGEAVEQITLIADAEGVGMTKPVGHKIIVPGDRDRIKQALINLLDNAIKYNRSGGTVRVEVTADSDMAAVTVRDTGIGIAPESREFIFDRFYRANTDRGMTGAGLGLAIVRSICHAHGGSVSAHSVVGEGSMFTMYFPSGGTSSTT